MLDVAERRGITIDFDALARELACPVMGINATKKTKITKLKQLIANESSNKHKQQNVCEMPASLAEAVRKISSTINAKHETPDAISRFCALRLLEGGEGISQYVPPEVKSMLIEQNQAILTKCDEEADILMADARYTFAHKVAKQVSTQKAMPAKTITQWIDKIVLNRFLGVPIFFAVMYAMFFFSINVAGAFQDFFDMPVLCYLGSRILYASAMWIIDAKINKLMIVTSAVLLGE